MKRERVTEEEILAALRRQGIAEIEDVEAVMLETDSSFSVLRTSGSAPGSTLSNICARSSEDCSGCAGTFGKVLRHERTSL